MTTERPPIEALEATLAKAPKEPWRSYTTSGSEFFIHTDVGPKLRFDMSFETTPTITDVVDFDTAEAIVALRNAAPNLFAWIRELETREAEAILAIIALTTAYAALEARLALPVPQEVEKLVAELRDSARLIELNLGISAQVTIDTDAADTLTAQARRIGELESLQAEIAAEVERGKQLSAIVDKLRVVQEARIGELEAAIDKWRALAEAAAIHLDCACFHRPGGFGGHAEGCIRGEIQVAAGGK
jgi:hypothetical protein